MSSVLRWASAEDPLGAMIAGDANAFRIPNAFGTPSILERAHQGRMERFDWPAQFRTYSLGGTLDQSESLDAHLNSASLFRAALGDDVEDAVRARIAELACGRTVEPARAPDGRTYVPLTIKVIAPDGYIPPHCEIEQLARSPYDHLRGVLDTTTILGFFVVLAPPERGGALRVSALTWAMLDKSKMREQRTHEAIVPVIDDHPYEELSPAPGDLVVFDGGRHVHQVMPVHGCERISIGGFLGLTKDDRVLYWG
jgi:hypothetical protein